MNALTKVFPSIAMPKVSANMRSENSDIAGCSCMNENPYHVPKSVIGSQAQAYEFVQSEYDRPKTSMHSNSREDKAMLKLLDHLIELTPQGHYQLPLPWRPGVTELPNKRALSVTVALATRSYRAA